MEPLTELEKIIIDDSKGFELKIIMKRLEEMVSIYTEELRKPNFQYHYNDIEKQRNACISAINIVSFIWEFHHKK